MNKRIKIIDKPKQIIQQLKQSSFQCQIYIKLVLNHYNNKCQEQTLFIVLIDMYVNKKNIFLIFLITLLCHAKQLEGQPVQDYDKKLMQFNDKKQIKINKPSQTTNEFYGKIFILPNESSILCPSMLFDFDSFEKQYVVEAEHQKFYQIHEALQIIKTYNLTSYNFNISNNQINQVFVNQNGIFYFITVGTTGLFQIYQIQFQTIKPIFLINIGNKWTNMDILNENNIILHNSTDITYIFYQNSKASKVVYNIQTIYNVAGCTMFLKQNSDNNNTANSQFQKQKVNQERLYYLCYTSQSNTKFYDNEANSSQLNLLLFLIQRSGIKLVSVYEIQTLDDESNQIIGVEVIDQVDDIILLCYNVYQFQKQKQKNDEANGQEQQFKGSFCSLNKLDLKSNMIILENIMQIYSDFPLHAISLQFQTVLAVVSEQKLQIFQYKDEISQLSYKYQVIYPQNFNCKKNTKINLQQDTIILACIEMATDLNQDNTIKANQIDNVVSLILVYDYQIMQYIPVGNLLTQAYIYNTLNFVFSLSSTQLRVRSSNQYYLKIYQPSVNSYIKIYQFDSNQKSSLSYILQVVAAQHGHVYTNKDLQKNIVMDYDAQTSVQLKSVFIGSNITYIQVQISISKQFQFSAEIQKNSSTKVFNYDYKWLLSIYNSEKCIRIIKHSDASFFRVIQIQKNRVSESASAQQASNNSSHMDKVQQLGSDFVYYTQLCQQNSFSFTCELLQVNYYLSDIAYNSENQHFMYIRKRKAKSNARIEDLYEIGRNSEFYNTEGIQQFFSFQLNQSLVHMKFDKNMLLVESSHAHYITHAKYLLQKLIRTKQKRQNFKNNTNFKNNFKLKHIKLQKSKKKKYFIQQNHIILTQYRQLVSDKHCKKIIHIYNRKSLKLFKKVQMHANIRQSCLNYKDEAFSEVSQYTGLYNNFIIIVNETHLTKYTLIANPPQLVYDYKFNTQSDQTQNGQQITRQKILYVLFLKRYVMVQFTQFYQIYDIGGNQIQIQIAVNFFNVQDKLNILNRKSPNSILSKRVMQAQNPDNLKNVVINDAFLVGEQDIILYEQGKFLITKYITNPILNLGPYGNSNSVVQETYEIIAKPFQVGSQNFINQNISQIFSLNVHFHHLTIQFVGKQIKQFNIPQAAQDYQIQIKTAAFVGPVMQFYLSDSFDDEMLIKQHMQNVFCSDCNSIVSLPQKTAQVGCDNKQLLNAYFFIQNQRKITSSAFPEQSFMLLHNKTHIFYLSCTRKVISSAQINILGYQNSLNSVKKYFTVLTDKSMFLIVLSQKIFFVLQLTQNQLSLSTFLEHKISLEYMTSNQIQLQASGYSLNDQTQQVLFLTSIKNTLLLHIFQFYITFKDIPTIQFVQTIKLKTIILSLFVCQLTQQVFILNQNQQIDICQYELSKNQQKQQNKSQLQLSFKTVQTVKLIDLIPQQYSVQLLYNQMVILYFKQAFEFKVTQTSNKQKQNKNKTLDPDNTFYLSLLIFSLEDTSFHVNLDLNPIDSIHADSQQKYSVSISNIYAGYSDYIFSRLISIHKNQLQNQSNDPYSYFILQYMNDETDSTYIAYYGFNHRFRLDFIVGYIRYYQNLTPQIQKLSQLKEDDAKYQFRYMRFNYAVFLQIQSIQQNNGSSVCNQANKVISSSYYEVNTSIYLILNYKKPPPLSYAVLHARNQFQSKSMYAKINVIKQPFSWTVTAYGFGSFILISFLMILMLKKCQFCKQSYGRSQISYSVDPSTGQAPSLRTQLLSEQRQQKIVGTQDDEDYDYDQQDEYFKQFKKDYRQFSFGQTNQMKREDTVEDIQFDIESQIEQIQKSGEEQHRGVEDSDEQSQDMDEIMISIGYSPPKKQKKEKANE